LRDRFTDKAAAEPEVLAHHFTQAGLTDAAIDWWGRAGDQALRRSAFQEAIAHLARRSRWRTRPAKAHREPIRLRAPPADESNYKRALAKR
jgi:hypothetical protein